MSERIRPWPVSVVAIVSVMGSAMSLWGLVSLARMGTEYFSMMQATVATAVIQIIVLGLAGIGLWRMRNWARWLMIITLSVELGHVGFVVLPLYVRAGVFSKGPQIYAALAVPVLLPVILIWYFIRPATKRCFLGV